VYELLRTAAPPALAAASSLLIDQLCARRGLLPPGFRVSENTTAVNIALARRLAAGLVVTVVLWIGVFAPLGTLGSAHQIDPSTISTPQLFLLHGLLLVAIVSWYLFGFGAGGTGRQWSQFGMRATEPLKEIGLGLGAGLVAWISVIAVMVLSGIGVWAVGGQDLLPQAPPPLVPWLAGLPLLLRLAVSMSAGFAEELFFRGFLQPRAGVALSTALFVLAHLSYEQPFMLLGVTLLSLIFAFLVVWRQSIWAAVTAHATFDAVQLTIMIPWALKYLDGGQLPVASATLRFLWL
jgi:membrane protease YdiL (CAAX protease family)